MARPVVNDDLWALMEPLLPPPKPRRHVRLRVHDLAHHTTKLLIPMSPQALPRLAFDLSPCFPLSCESISRNSPHLWIGVVRQRNQQVLPIF